MKQIQRVPFKLLTLKHLLPMHPFGFLMFSGGREKVHWEKMG